MKLDNKQKVLLCQKALYAKQLVAYANLCKVYKTLAGEIKKDGMPNASQELLSEHVQKYYGKFLAKAAQGDLSFIDKENGPIFNETEKQAFYAFSEHSMRLEYFRGASEVLFDATHPKGKDTFSIDEEKMDKFNSYLNPPQKLFSDDENKFFDSTGRSFSKMLAENPKRWIGHTYYRIAKNALKVIDEIDSNHIASLNTKGVSLSPKSFGATITGARGRISPSREFSSPKQEFSHEMKTMYTPAEEEKYKNRVSPLENLGAKMYGAAYNTKEKAKATYTAHKGTLKKALIQGAKILAALGVAAAIALAAKAGIDAHTFNQLSAQTNADQGYHIVVNQDTLDKLDNLELRIDETENLSSIPSTQELTDLRDDIDDVLDLVVEDLVRQSFEEQYPNLKIAENGIQTSYDKSKESAVDSRTGNEITIICHDASGKEYKYVIDAFASQGEDRIGTYFDDQYKLDYQIKGDIYNSASGTYKSRTEAVGNILDQFRDYLKHSYELAGTDAVLDIPDAQYDNAVLEGNDNVFDYLKAKASLFRPRFKSVIPEKIQTTETPAPAVESTERDDR